MYMQKIVMKEHDDVYSKLVYMYSVNRQACGMALPTLSVAKRHLHSYC